MLDMNRRTVSSTSIPSQPAIDDAPWKNISQETSLLTGSNSTSSLNSDPVIQSSFSTTATNQGIGFQSSNQTGSNTPQYTSSPAPSGSSTPGPAGVQTLGGPYTQTTNNVNYNGPVGGPFGSPSSLGQFGRPASTGNPFNSGQNHFSSPNVFGASAQYSGISGVSSFSQGSNLPNISSSHNIDRMDPGLRRHNSYFSHTEHRVFELNKRLQQRTEDSDNCWWDSFTTEFFEDDSKLTILFCLEDGPKRYTIGRTLIPRFFRSIFDGGVSDLYFQLKHSKESFHNTSITLDCDQCTVSTQHGKPFFTKVCADARLILEFMYDDYMRIKSWHMTIKGHRELIPRSVVGTALPPDHMLLEQITKNITRAGITNSTLNYLRLCVILEPMQELMSRHKAYALSPRDCLKTTLFQKWQRMVAPPGKKDPQRPANKRRKRKGSNSAAAAATPGNTPLNSQKRGTSNASYSLSSQDVMVVGEPTLMGGEFGEEDERLITRLENTQYDGSNSVDQEPHSSFSHGESPLPGTNPWNVDRSGGMPPSPGCGPVTQSSEVEKKSPIVNQ